MITSSALPNEGNMNTEKRYPASRNTKLDRMVARLKEILQCIICLEIVGSPAVQCEAGHLMCGQCRDNLEENTCPTCRQPLIAVRNRAVEQVVEVLPKSCPNADYGCQEMLIADEMDAHKVTCPFRQFRCPRPPCPWVGYKPEILGHMLDTHPQHVLSSNRQTVEVPVKWDEVSSWLMFLNDEVLILKFSVDRATNFLLGSFECLGQLNPAESITYHMTVKRGDRETTLSGSIAPDRSTADRQSVEEWDNVFPRSRYDDHPESESSTSSRCIKVDVAIEDNRGIAVAQASVDVEVQTQATFDVEVQTQASVDVKVQTHASIDVEVQTQVSVDVEVQTEASDDDDVLTQFSDDDVMGTQACEDVEGAVGDKGGGGDATRRVDGENQSDETAYRVIKKLGSWFGFGFYDFEYSTSPMSKTHDIITETKKNIVSGLVTSISAISKFFQQNSLYYHCMEMYLYRLSQDFSATKIKMDRVRAAGGRHFKQSWMLAYFLIVEQAVYETFSKYVDKFPDIDGAELEKLITTSEKQTRVERSQRVLRWAHVSGGSQGVESLITHMGHVYKRSDKEISSLRSDATTIPWSDINPVTVVAKCQFRPELTERKVGQNDVQQSLKKTRGRKRRV